MNSRASLYLHDVCNYLSSLRLLLNPEKTKILWCQSPHSRTVTTIIASPSTFNGKALSPDEKLKYLGVILDSHLPLSANVTATSSTCFSMLRRVR